jgi:DNA-directed RNA polymerase subunit RPC12/RpoP
MEETVAYYCYSCKKDVDCHLSVWIERVVSLAPPHRIKIQVEARCSNCDMPIGGSSEIVELY